MCSKHMATCLQQAAASLQPVIGLNVLALHKQSSMRLVCQQDGGQAGLLAVQQAVAPGWKSQPLLD